MAYSVTPTMALDDPAFPHGELRGYRRGCGRPAATLPCPATPTCADRQRESNAEWRSRNPYKPVEPGHRAVTHYVRNRLRTTIQRHGIEAVAAAAERTPEQVREVLAWPERTMPFEVSEPVDYAWALLVHGSDTRAPDFEHGGTSRGYRRRCRCRHCVGAASKTEKLRAQGHQTDRSILTDPVLIERTAQHVARLREDFSFRLISRACGHDKLASVRAAMNKEPVQIRTALALLALRPADVAKIRVDDDAVDGAETEHLIRTMWAMGYPLLWQQRQIGGAALHIVRPGRGVLLRTANRVRALADRIGNTPPDPERDGLSLNVISKTRHAARRAGWFPPGCYDDDRNLDPRSIPEHPWAMLDAAAARTLRAMTMRVRGSSCTVAAEATGLNTRTVERLPVKLVFESGNGRDLDWKRSAPEIKRIRAVTDPWEDGDLGSVTAALMLGMRPNIGGFGRQWDSDFASTEWGRERGEVPGRHPEVVAWLAAQAPETTTEGESISRSVA